MDTSFTSEQVEIRGLADSVLSKSTSKDSYATGDGWFDPTVWRALASTGLLGIALAEDVGGGGRGLVEACLVLEQVGAYAARTPCYAALIGMLAVDRFGSDELRRRLLPDAVAGNSVITVALAEPDAADLLRPRTTAIRLDSGWRLTGIKTCVPAAEIAEVVIVPAAVGSDIALFAVPSSAAGVGLTRQTATTGEPQARLELDGAEVADDALIGAPEPGAGTQTLAAVTDFARVGLCAMQLGCSTSALKLTAQWVTQRHQFGQPLASFQAVRMRLADAFIALDGCRLTLWQAAWRSDQGLDARDEVRIAKYWAAEASTAVTLTAHRLHGGVGMDPAGALAPFTLLSRQIEFSLGGARAQLRELGDSISARSSATTAGTPT